MKCISTTVRTLTNISSLISKGTCWRNYSKTRTSCCYLMNYLLVIYYIKAYLILSLLLIWDINIY